VAVLPRSFPRNEVAAILAVREAWICRHLDAYAAMRPAPLLNNLEHGAQIPYLGMSITLVCNGKTGAKEAYYSGGNLIVHQGCGNGTLGNVIERWYREQAVDMLERKTGHYGSLMGSLSAGSPFADRERYGVAAHEKEGLALTGSCLWPRSR
jgi:predicted metal-dependent hydrolase